MTCGGGEVSYALSGITQYKSLQMAASSNVKLDVSRLLRSFGGGAMVRKKLAILGFEDVPNAYQMRKWTQRAMIPGKWLLVLAAQAKAEGRVLDLTEFMS